MKNNGMDTTQKIEVKFEMDIMGNWWLVWENKQEGTWGSYFIGKNLRLESAD